MPRRSCCGRFSIAAGHRLGENARSLKAREGMQLALWRISCGGDSHAKRRNGFSRGEAEGMITRRGWLGGGFFVGVEAADSQARGRDLALPHRQEGRNQQGTYDEGVEEYTERKGKS